MRWFKFRGVLRDLCSHLPPEASPRELRRAKYYLTSVAGPEKEREVRKALLSAAAGFEPVKETDMALLEHLEKRGEKLGKTVGQREGRLSTLLRFLSAAFPELTDAASVRELTDEALDEITDSIALRRSWREIRNLLRDKRNRLSPGRR